MFNHGTVNLVNCTISGNSANTGGGLFNYGLAAFISCTVTGNIGDFNYTVYDYSYNGSKGTLALTDSIVADNNSPYGFGVNLGSSPGEAEGGFTGSYNLLSSAGPSGMVNGQDGNIIGEAILSPLGDYGGPTQTVALLPGCPAIGAGIAVQGVTSDQRGEPLDSPHPDIGAFQSQGFDLTVVAGSTPQSTAVDTAFANSIAVTVTAKDPLEPVAGGWVQFVAPSSGASAVLPGLVIIPPGTTSFINSDGVAGLTPTANATVGSYIITATALGAPETIDFNLTNLAALTFTGIANQSITYGTSSVTVSGELTSGPQAPVGESVAVTLDGVQQSAQIESGGVFSTTFDTTSLTVASSPYTVNYAYTSDGTFSSASTTSTLTVTKATPALNWPSPADITYGTALSATQLDATASVPGTFTYTPAAGTVLSAGIGQPLSVAFTPTDATDYSTVDATATIDVDKVTPAITWADPSDITYGTALSAAQLDATASVSGTFSYTPVAGTILGAGADQTLSVAFTPTDMTDYNTTSATATINVDKTSPTITWANPAVITYGTALGSTQLDATESVPGTFSYMPAAGTVMGAGTDQTLSVAFTPGDTNDYNTASASATITIYQATPSITWADPATIIYGTALSAAQLDAAASWTVAGVAGSVPGTFAYTPAAGTLLGAGSDQTLSVAFTPTDTNDYIATSSTTTINVEKATPSITWADPATIIYGTALSAAQLDATASVPGTLTYTPAAGTILHAGADQTLSVAFTPTDANDYNTSSGTTTITVDKATPTVAWADPATITYGTALSATQLDATASVPGSFAYTPAAGTILHAGADQTLSVAFTPTDSNDYNTASASTAINVSKAPTSIIWADPADITYGTALSATQLDATASVPGTLTYTPTLGTILHAGSDQTLSVAFNPTDTNDYNSSTATTAIVVDKATPTIAWADPADITYGTALSATQLDATASVRGTFAYTPAAGTILAAGAGLTLRVTFTPQDGTSYVATSATTSIDIARATPTLSLSDPGGHFDGSAFPASYTIAGSGSENVSAASLQDITPTVTYYNDEGSSLGASPPSAPGSYTVVAVFPGNVDYAAVQTKAVPFTIAPGIATVTLASSSSSAAYGQAVTFVATVAATAGTPGGTVTFFDGGTPLASVAIDGSGKATLTTLGLALGSNAITATYSGDAEFLGGPSATTSESVAKADTRVVLVPHPVFHKKKLVSVGLTAEVETISPGGGLPTGAVTFEVVKKTRKKLKVTTLGALPLSGGEATLNLKPNKVLKKPLTVIYGGDTDFLAVKLTPPTLTKQALAMLS